MVGSGLAVASVSAFASDPATASGVSDSPARSRPGVSGPFPVFAASRSGLAAGVPAVPGRAGGVVRPALRDLPRDFEPAPATGAPVPASAAVTSTSRCSEDAVSGFSAAFCAVAAGSPEPSASAGFGSPAGSTDVASAVTAAGSALPGGSASAVGLALPGGSTDVASAVTAAGLALPVDGLDLASSAG